MAPSPSDQGNSGPLPTSDKLVDLRIARLNMLQAAIARMAGYSATSKNFCITVLAAVVALSVQAGTAQLVIGAAVATACLALLDLYYLSLELRFREAYEAAAAGPLADADMTVRPVNTGARHVGKALRSPSILMFYTPILVGCVVAPLLAAPAPTQKSARAAASDVATAR